MKKTLLLTLAAAAVITTGCSKQMVGNTDDPAGANGFSVRCVQSLRSPINSPAPIDFETNYLTTIFLSL